MTMIIKAFIESPQNSDTSYKYNEEKLVLKSESKLPARYPYSYGFVPKTRAEDNDCVDVYVIDNIEADTGDYYEGSILGLLEFWEDEEEDHKILIGPENMIISEEIVQTLQDFMTMVFKERPGKIIRFGKSHDKHEAIKYLQKSMI